MLLKNENSCLLDVFGLQLVEFYQHRISKLIEIRRVEFKLSKYQRICQRIFSRCVIFLNKEVYLLLFSCERMKSIQSKVQSSLWHRPFLASDATFLFVWNQPVDLFYTWSWTIPIKTCSILFYSIRVADSASVFFYSSEMPTHLQLDAHL